MKRFNLSGWAVSHPALILFLIVALGFAGGDEGRMLATLVGHDGVEAAFTPTRASLRVGFQVVEPNV